ncbi:hypothetical protein [Spirosoma koreense]
MDYPIVKAPDELIKIVKWNPLLENQPVKPEPPQKDVLPDNAQLPPKPIEPILEENNVWFSSIFLTLLGLYFVHLSDKTDKDFYGAIAMIIFILTVIRAIRTFQKNEYAKDKFKSYTNEYSRLLKEWKLNCDNINKEHEYKLKQADLDYQKKVKKYNTIILKDYEEKQEQFNTYLTTDEAYKERRESKLSTLINYLSINVKDGIFYDFNLSPRRGVSEYAFCEYLQENWKEIDDEKYFTLKSFALNRAIDGSKYRPDITFELLIGGKYIESKKDFFIKDVSIYIDIEIDEPYVGLTGQPIHYIDCNDDIRDNFFIKNGWIVVRFTEEQVVKTPDLCLSFLRGIILECLSYSKTQSLKFPNSLASKILLITETRSKQWTKDEAHEMAFKRYRNTYLSKAFIEHLSTGIRD